MSRVFQTVADIEAWLDDQGDVALVLRSSKKDTEKWACTCLKHDGTRTLTRRGATVGEAIEKACSAYEDKEPQPS